MNPETKSDALSSTSVWKEIKNGQWTLFFDCDRNLKVDKPLTSDVHLKSFQESKKEREFNLGSLVITPKGIGRLIKLEGESATVKFLKTDEDIDFSVTEIYSEFPIYVRVIGGNYDNWLKLIVPAIGSVEMLKKVLEDNGILDTSSNFYLVFGGQELREDFFFDQLDIQIGARLLLAKLKMTPCKVERFPQRINQWWYISTNFDGITFSVNKKIKLTGFGLLGSHENKTYTCNVKIIEGTPTNQGLCLLDDNVEVPPAINQNENVTPFHFKKGVMLKPNVQYTAQQCIVQSQNNYAYVYYGSSGTAIVEGERKVEFTFTYVSGYSTSVESGIFPEFYYLC